jgi:NADH dehydrogenase FAD-containing subunit
MALISSVRKNTSKLFTANQLILARACFSTSNTDKQVKKTEVLIVGGGITGASLACALSQSEYFNFSQDDLLKKIVLLDNTRLPAI